MNFAGVATELPPRKRPEKPLRVDYGTVKGACAEAVAPFSEQVTV